MQKIINVYEVISKWGIIKSFLEQFLEAEQIICRKEFQEIPEEEKNNYISRRFYCGYSNAFYLRLYIRNMDYSNIMDELSESEFEQLMLKCKIPKRTREKYSKLYHKFKGLEKEKQKILQELVLRKPT